MNVTKVLFGMGLLAVAVWLLSRILPVVATLFLWVCLLAIPLMMMSWHKHWKGVTFLSLIYGIVLFVGVTTHRHESLPSLLCNVAAACEKLASLAFTQIRSREELQQQLTEAHAKNQWIMLDFYADWCTSCQEMEHYTFADPRVQSALSGVVLLQADVTQNTATDQALLKQSGLIGPPAILFFGPDKQERVADRIVGFQHAGPFLDHLRQVFK